VKAQVLSFLAILVTVTLVAQQTPPAEVTKEYSGADDTVSFAERIAVYPGGEEGMFQDIYNGIKYPDLERELQVQGLVIVSFVVEKDGSVSKVEAVREVEGGPGLSREAVRAVKSLKGTSKNSFREAR